MNVEEDRSEPAGYVWQPRIDSSKSFLVRAPGRNQLALGPVVVGHPIFKSHALIGGLLGRREPSGVASMRHRGRRPSRATLASAG